MLLLAGLVVATYVGGRTAGRVLARRARGDGPPPAVRLSDELSRVLDRVSARRRDDLSAAVRALDAEDRLSPWGRFVDAALSADPARLDALALAAGTPPAVAARAAHEAIQLREAASGDRDEAGRSAFVRTWPASWWARDAMGSGGARR